MSQHPRGYGGFDGFDGYEENNGFGGYEKREMKMGKPLFPLASRLPEKAEMVDEITLPEGATSLHFMQAIYRDGRQPMTRRMRAAQIAIPFEHAKLEITLDSDGFANVLEEAMVRLGKTIVIDAAGHKAVEGDGNASEASPKGFGFSGKEK